MDIKFRRILMKEYEEKNKIGDISHNRVNHS